MSIRAECLACRTVFRIDDRNAGRRGKCPRCNAPIEVPTATPPPAATARTAAADEPEIYALADAPTRVRTAGVPGASAGSIAAEVREAVEPCRPKRTPAEILAAFRGEIEPVRPTLLYRLWILIVAAVMLLLPLIYVAIIALVGLAVCWHAVHDLAIFQHVRNPKAALLLYGGPLVIGGVTIAFLLKPLFARPGRRPKARALDPAVEPLLFAFVDGVCAAVGAPRPSRIEVDCQVNASARLVGGPLGIVTGELVLTIGLPLAAGLSLRQFAGVLAHEFGHFSQGAGMRLLYLIWSINAWFARVVYERDEWDETLSAWSREGNGSVVAAAVAGLARLAVWLTRGLLRVLMLVGHGVSSFLSRQMEFDADRYEARMVGGEVFAATMRSLGELGLAEQMAYSDLSTSWQERRLPDHLPKLIQANRARIPAEVRDALRQARAQRRTGLFDTHPSDGDRIARAQAEGTEGLFRRDGSATDLFHDFDALARRASLDHYRALLGPQITKDQLFPVAEVVQLQAIAQRGNEAFDRFFLGGFGPFLPLPLPTAYPTEPADLKAAKRALVESRSAMQAAQGEVLAARQRWDELQSQAAAAETAAVLLRAGNRIKPDEFGLAAATLQAAESAANGAETAARELASSTGPFEAAAANRLAMALALLESDAVATRVPDGNDRRAEARALYPCAAYLGGRIVRDLPRVWRAQQVLGRLLQQFQQGKNDRNQPLINACLRASGQLRDRLVELQARLGSAIPYPFEHAQDGITVGRFALATVPQDKAISELLQTSDQTLDKLTTLHRRVLARLLLTAEEVERTLGLSPLASNGPAASETLSAIDPNPQPLTPNPHSCFPDNHQRRAASNSA